MKKIYWCMDCDFFANEDFWECPNCHNESKVIQISIDNDSLFSFFQLDNVSNKTCKSIVEKYLCINNIKYESLCIDNQNQKENVYINVVVDF